MIKKLLSVSVCCVLLASPVMAQNFKRHHWRKALKIQKALNRNAREAMANKVPVAAQASVGFMPNIYAKANQVSYAGSKATLTIEKDLPGVITIGSKLKIYNERNEETQVVVTNVNGNSFTVEGLNQLTFGNNLFVFGKEVNDFKPVDFNAMSIMNATENQLLRAELDLMKKRLHSTESQGDDLAAQQREIQEIKDKLDHYVNQQITTKPKANR